MDFSFAQEETADLRSEHIGYRVYPVGLHPTPVVEECPGRLLLQESFTIVDATHVIANMARPYIIKLPCQARRAVGQDIDRETRVPQPILRQSYKAAEAVHHEHYQNLCRLEVHAAEDTRETEPGSHIPAELRPSRHRALLQLGLVHSSHKRVLDIDAYLIDNISGLRV